MKYSSFRFPRVMGTNFVFTNRVNSAASAFSLFSFPFLIRKITLFDDGVVFLGPANGVAQFDEGQLSPEPSS